MDLQSALLAIQPAIKPAPQVVPARQAKPRPTSGQPRRVPVATFDCGRIEVYGSKGAHSESREPPTHEYFPERHFGGPVFTNIAPYYPELIHRTSK